MTESSRVPRVLKAGMTESSRVPRILKAEIAGTRRYWYSDDFWSSAFFCTAVLSLRSPLPPSPLPYLGGCLVFCCNSWLLLPDISSALRKRISDTALGSKHSTPPPPHYVRYIHAVSAFLRRDGVSFFSRVDSRRTAAAV